MHALATIVVLSVWIFGVVFGSNNGRTRSLWWWAIGLRLSAMFIAPTLSDDVFRYVWEGFFITEGGNPYWIAPIDSSLEHWSKSLVNHPELTTIYPPLTQIICTVLSLAFDNVMSWKVLSTVCDLGVLWILFRQQGPSKWVWLYALHPLPILESSSSAHMETWAIVPLVASMMFPSVRAWLLWLGGMLKLLPFVLLPVALRSWKSAIAMIMLLILSLSVFSLWSVPIGAQRYAQHWSFHASVFAVLDSWTENPRVWTIGIGGLSMLYTFWKVRPFSKQVFWLVGTFILLSPTVHPWYLLWVFPVAIWHRSVAWVGLCCAYPLWYVALTTWDVSTQSWEPPMWPQIVSYGFFVGLLLWKWIKRYRKQDFGGEECGK
ncbi:MAG: hypothetical protein CL916_06150 [Deltaproteobacteria bacterium]|nr:hypothetical protein [Deltaproteobacteria bacterium]